MFDFLGKSDHRISIDKLRFVSRSSPAGWTAQLVFSGFILVEAGPLPTPEEAKDSLRPFAYALNHELGIRGVYEDRAEAARFSA